MNYGLVFTAYAVAAGLCLFAGALTLVTKPAPPRTVEAPTELRPATETTRAA